MKGGRGGNPKSRAFRGGRPLPRSGLIGWHGKCIVERVALEAIYQTAAA